MAKSNAYIKGYIAGSNVHASMASPFSLFSDVGLEWLQGWEDGDKARRSRIRRKA